MTNLLKNKKWAYFLLIIPLILAILALNEFGFFFKSGSAGAGILIILFVYFKQLSKRLDVWMIVLAFLFSIIGDWFLSNMHGNPNIFVTGIVFFFLAHIGYLTYALLNGKLNYLFTGIVLAGYLVFFFFCLYPSIKLIVLMWAALIYLIISCFSFGAALGIRGKDFSKGLYVFGIFLVLFSDTIIAFKEFASYQDLNFLILPTYYLAHISIIASLMCKRLS